MTSDDIGANDPVPSHTPRQHQFPAGIALISGLVGLVLGAAATFAITGLVWTVRVELPPPPYPQWPPALSPTSLPHWNSPTAPATPAPPHTFEPPPAPPPPGVPGG